MDPCMDDDNVTGEGCPQLDQQQARPKASTDALAELPDVMIKRGAAQKTDAETPRKDLVSEEPDPKRSKVQHPLVGSVQSSKGSEASFSINKGEAADLLLTFPDALLPHCDKKTICTLRLVCKATCDAISSRTRCLSWNGAESVSQEDYAASQTVFSKCPNLDRVRGCYPHSYLALADLPTRLTALEIEPPREWNRSADFEGFENVLQTADLSPLTALTGLKEAALHGLPAPLTANLDFGDSLRSLNISGSNDLESIPALRVLPSLNELAVCGLHIKDISSLSECTNLHMLRMLVGGRTDTSVLSKCTNLHTLDLAGIPLDFPLVMDLSAWSACSNLRTLNLTGMVLGIETLAEFRNLHTLVIRHRGLLGNAMALSRCSSLQVLDLSRCELGDIALGPSLQSLKVRSAPLGIVSACPNLSLLHVLAFDMATEVDLSPLSGCLNLGELKLVFTSTFGTHAQLLDISALSSCTKLHTLSLHEAKELSSIEALSPLTKLHTLSLRGAEELSSIEALSPCTNLQTLDLSGCLMFQDIKALLKLPKLYSLNLSRCRQLTNLAVLSSFSNLRTLELWS